MENNEKSKLIQNVSFAFMELEPEFIETDNPYEAAKFYKDLADSDLSLYTKKDYHRLHSLLASTALHNGRIKEFSKNGCVLNFIFSFSDEGNFEEFREYLSQNNFDSIK